MFNMSFDAALKQIRLLPANRDGDAANVALLSFACDLTHDIATGLGVPGEDVRSAIRAGAMLSSVLTLEEEPFDLCMIDGEGAEHTIPTCTGRRLIAKESKDGEALAVIDIEARWDENDLLWLAEHNGASMSVRLNKQQLTLAAMDG